MPNINRIPAWLVVHGERADSIHLDPDAANKRAHSLNAKVFRGRFAPVAAFRSKTKAAKRKRL